jgi:hypothetical protein
MNVIYHKGGNVMNCKIWDKKENINGIDAEYVIDSMRIQENDEVFLILDNANNVQAIEIARIIKGVYNLDINLTVDEVAKEYIRIHEEEALQAERNIINSEEQLTKIANLETSMLQIMQELKTLKEMISEIVSK